MYGKKTILACVLGTVLCLGVALVETEASEIGISKELASRLYGGGSGTDKQCNSSTACNSTAQCSTYATEEACAGKHHNSKIWTEKYCKSNSTMDNTCAESSVKNCINKYTCTWNETEPECCENGSYVPSNPVTTVCIIS